MKHLSIQYFHPSLVSLFCSALKINLFHLDYAYNESTKNISNLLFLLIFLTKYSIKFCGHFLLEDC